LAKIANERDLLVISYEVYEKITYDVAITTVQLGFLAFESAQIVVRLSSKHSQ